MTTRLLLSLFALVLWGSQGTLGQTTPGTTQAHCAAAQPQPARQGGGGGRGAAQRKPGEKPPFLTGADTVRRYMTVVEEVARAGLALPRP